MRILIDCTHTARHTYKNTGIHRVVRELTSELLNITSQQSDIEVVMVRFDGQFIRRVNNLHKSNQTHHLDSNKSLNEKIDGQAKFVILISKVKNKLLNKISLISPLNWLGLIYYKVTNIEMKFEGIEISPGDIYIIADANWDLPPIYYYFLENLKKHKVTIAVICYDLIPIKFPAFCSQKFAEDFKKFYKNYSKLFDRVLCISQNSANDYKEAQAQGILDNKNSHLLINNFRLGCNYSNQDDLQNANIDNLNWNENIKNVLNERFVLIVGSLVPHKNIKNIMAAFNLLLDAGHQDVHLVFAGNNGWHLETDTLIESNKMYGKLIHILGSVTDTQLKFLYKKCYCLVQASFYEGFGLPVVEALQHCKPVIASNGGSLPEVGGEFCIYFDPHQPVELYQALENLITSESYYSQLVEKIQREYKPFSWQESAIQFLFELCN